jgi:dipeptidyl aminopeptidase/acylaminoacyl peptidase
MTFEDMMAMKRLGETAVSPDGKWLAYGVTSVNLDQNSKTAELWLQKIEGGEPFKLAVAKAGDGGVDFAADGKRILFTSSRDGSQQVWTADFDAATGATSNAKKLTSIATEADNSKWSPDGKFVVFTSAVYPDCPAITPDDAGGDKCNADRDKAAAESKVKAQIWNELLYRHWNHYTGPKRSHLFVVDVDSGKVRDLNPGDTHDVPPFSLGGGGGFAVSPDSKELAFTENPDAVPAISTSAQIWTLDLTNPAAKPVKISTSAGGNFNPAYSPDGKYIAWRSEARAGYESDKFRLLVYTRATHVIDDVLPKFDNWVDEFAWEPHSIIIYFTSGTTGEAPIYSVAVDLVQMKVKGAGVPIQITESGEFSDLHVVDEGRNVIAVRQLVAAPGEIVRINDQIELINVVKRDPNKPGEKDNIESIGIRKAPHGPYPITHLNDTLLSQLDLPKMQDFWFSAKDGTKLQGFVIPPPGFDAQKKYPVKFLIHGGPQGAWGDAWSYRWNAELFAANGYVVVMINPRGSTGYGQAVVDGVNGDWGGKPYTDLMAGLDYAEQHYPFIDKSRECALGASYGGYMANWVLGHTDRFKCIVSHDGMFNAESAFGSTEEDWFNTWEFKGAPWDYYGKPDSENPFRKWSPSLYAKNFKTPTLVVHGQLDYRLDVSEGFQLFDTLQLRHVPSQMLYFPDEGHWVLKPQNSQLWYKTVNAWVDKWTAAAH